MPRILIVDDEATICWNLNRLFRSEGHEVVVAGSAEQAFDAIASWSPDLILLDVHLPGQNGFDAIERFQQKLHEVPIVLMTAFCDLETAVKAFRKHVAEYLPKPFDLDRVLAIVNKLLGQTSTRTNPDAALSPTRLGVHRNLRKVPQLVGNSPAMQEVYRRIALASSSDTPVLITGESGTGKELVANAIHLHSQRREQELHAVALPSIGETLLESELFGHSRGAFTGAAERRDGIFAVASQGSLLLDEIGDLPLSQQVKLLRVMESGEYSPLGTSHVYRSQARILAATNRDLLAQVKAGLFRQDLYFRLAIFQIELPPLRNRLEDMPDLCYSILDQLGRVEPKNAIDSNTLEWLANREWPGNIRELRNHLEHANLMSRGGRIDREHFPVQLESSRQDSSVGPGNTHPTRLRSVVSNWMRDQLMDAHATGLYDLFLDEVEPTLIASALDATEGNQVAAAKLLGIHRSTLREKMKKKN